MTNPFGGASAQAAQQPAQTASASVSEGDDFDLIANAQMFQSSPKMNPEHTYLLVVEKMLWKKSGRNSSKNFILEAQIEQTDDPKYGPGSVVGYVVNNGQEGWEGRVLAILCSCVGIDPSDQKAVDNARQHFAQGLRDAIGPENPQKGKRIVAKTGARTTSKNNREYMPVAFHPFTP